MVWSDRRVQELAKSFVAVADKVEPYQNQKGKPDATAESAFLWSLSRQRKDFQGLPGQGVYVATPSGTLLAFRQTDHDPERILALLKESLEGWNRMDPKVRRGREGGRGEDETWRGESSLPADGLVLQLFVRDLPRKDGTPAAKFAGMWNQDFVWFTRDEVRSMIPESRRIGERHAAPDRIVRRLAKVHFIDLVRGVTPAYEDNHVEKAEMAFVIERVEGDLVQFKIEGATRAERKAKPNPRIETDYGTGYEGNISGRATFDGSKNEFVSFEMVSVGTRWGGTRHNTRLEDNDVAPNPIGYALRLLPKEDRTDFRAPLYVNGYFGR